jgi:hypothetical protein
MNQYEIETMKIAKNTCIQEKFISEVNRLLKSGCIDPESNYSRGLLFGVALENVADGWLQGKRKTKEYRNMKCF